MEPTSSKPESHFCNFAHDKAGMQGIDRSKINQIILEASKDSEFFRHQQEESKKIEEKVHSYKNLIKRELNKGPAFVRVMQERINKRMQEYENYRIMTETWIHIDMDMFYASVEIRDDPSLADKPIAVGDNSMISTANYVARKFGVRSAMPGFIGKKLCEDLVFVKPNFAKYQVEGEKVREVFREFDPEFESLGLDEGHLRVTEVLINLGMNDDDGRMRIAQIIREKIFEKTKLTASAGIACNKVLAKIATDKGKPNGQFLVPFDREKIVEFMENLDVRKIPGIGKVLEKTLNELGIYTCKDILSKRLELYLAFGESSLDFLLKAALGIGQTSHSELRDDQKSCSISRTFKATDSHEKLKEYLQSFSKDISEELISKEASAKCISVQIKNFRFESKLKSETLPSYIHKQEDIYTAALKLFKELELREKVRLIGLRASHLIYNKPGLLERVLESNSETKPVSAVKVLEQKCPICNKLFMYTETRMQVHIDQCLNDQTPKPGQRGRKKLQITPKLTLDTFYRKK